MNLFYRDKGEGTPLVILHGLYGSSDNWMPIASKMSEQYRVISVDLRNHGSSPHYAEHTYSDMVTDLAWLFHEIGIEKAHLVGHSMGGKTAMAFAADYPEKIISLCIADIAPVNYLESPASALQYKFHKQLLETLNQLDLTAYETRKEVDSALKKDIPEKIVRQFILKNLNRQNNLFEWKINVKALKENLDEIIGGGSYVEYEDRLPILVYPVLFIRGSLSGYIGEPEIESIKKIYPEAEIATIEDATHLLHAEKPDEFTNLLRKFTGRFK